MNRGAAREERIALFAATVWTLAVAAAGRVGVWLAVGGAAVVLGVMVVVLDPAVRARFRPSWRWILVGLAAGAFMVAVTLVLSPVLHAARWLEDDLQGLYSLFRAAGPRVAAIALIPVIVGEELVWRGAVQGALERRVGARAAAPVSAALYALAHSPIGSPLLVVVAFGCGLLWTALRAATGSLVPCILSHAVWDAAVLLAFPLVPT